MCKHCFKAPPKGKNVSSMDSSDIAARANDVAVNYFSSDVIGVSVEPIDSHSDSDSDDSGKQLLFLLLVLCPFIYFFVYLY
jgi:hypothetical protein